MSTPSMFKLRFTIPSSMQNGTERAEGKSYILTLALSIEAEAGDMTCAEQIGLELVPSGWVDGYTTTEEPVPSTTMPGTDPDPGLEPMSGTLPGTDPGPGATIQVSDS